MKPRYNPTSHSAASPWAKPAGSESAVTPAATQSNAGPAADEFDLGTHHSQSWNRSEGGRYASGRNHQRPNGYRKSGEDERLSAAARARMELEALFSGGPSSPEPQSPTQPTQQAQPTTEQSKTLTALRPLDRAPAFPGENIAGVTVVRKRTIGACGDEATPPQTDRIKSATTESRQSKTHTIIKSYSVAPGSGSEMPATSSTHEEFDACAVHGGMYKSLSGKTMRTVSWPNPRVPNDIESARQRLASMEPLQALAWLILTSRADLKPLGVEEVYRHIAQLLEKIDKKALLDVKPAEYWIVEPLSEIAFTPSGECERVRPINAEGQFVHAHKLPGDLGAWVTSQRLSSSEAARRPTAAQRINAISLAGLLIANDRFDVLERFEPMDLDPFKHAATLGFDRQDLSKVHNGYDIGEINGYAVGLIAHANHFFKWIDPWQEVLREHIGLRNNEMTAALGLALKTWSMGHGELNQPCAEMTCTMLQLGAMINEAGLTALCAQAVKSSGKAAPAAGFARLCAQTFLMDSKGLAAQRVMQSARIGGFSVAPLPGHAHPLVPYAQANMVEAVATLVQEGLDPSIPDAMGKTVLQRAQSTRADRVIAFLEGGCDVSSLQSQAQSQAATFQSSPVQIARLAPSTTVVIETIEEQQQADAKDEQIEPAQRASQDEQGPLLRPAQEMIGKPQATDKAAPTLAIQPRIKPAARRRAAIEELRLEFERANKAALSA